MACSEVHAEVNTVELRRLSHTESFIASEYIVTRRDTEISVTLHGEDDDCLLHLDSAKLVHESGNEIEVEVYERRNDAKDTHLKLNTPPNTAVGVYKLVISGHFEDGKEFEATVPTKMVVLFNSWSSKDNAYLETETERQEYVLNKQKLLAGIPWEFDLNEPSCLRATMHLIERISKLSFDEKRNHPSVAAEISSLVERGDDFGVLETYRGGSFVSPPVLRAGSANYYRMGKESVHTWMFHGVLLSVFRVLGIPSRHVTEVLPTSPMLPDLDQPTLQLTLKEKENKKFKAWNEIWSHNVDISSAPKGWQVVDMTVTVLMATQGGWDAESKLVGFEGVPWLQGGNVMLDCTELHVKFQQLNLQAAMVIHTVDYNLLQNRTAHRTNFYEDDSLIIRRGQSFTIVLRSNSDMNMENPGILACFKLESEHSSVDTYSFEVNALAVIQGGTATVNLQTPATVAIGKYSIGLSLPDSISELSVQDVDVTLLFNPWCSDDPCFYSGNLLDLSEYVLNKSGSIWMGATTDHYGHFRQLSQFGKNSLEAAFLALTKMSLNDRADPVKVSKHITDQISADVDDGAMPMVNRWSGNYSEGINLMAWTLFRAVGLASRLVSNYDSGREASSYNRATEMSWSEDGSELFTGNRVLNFHTWNEVYMAWSNASPGFMGGWQALDAVPIQWRPNVSDSLPFKAIKMTGDMPPVTHLVNNNYLTVHKDESLFLTGVNLDQGYNRLRKENFEVLSPLLPPLIYTGKDELLSEETIGKSDISLLLQVQKGIMSGNNFGVKITFANRGTHQRQIQYYIHATTFKSHVALLDGVCDMDASQIKCVELEVLVRDYSSALSECKSILFTAMVSVPQENTFIFRTFTLKAPVVDIAVSSSSVHMGQVSTINVTLTNPLKIPLNDGCFFLHGNGFIEDNILPIGLVSADQSVQVTMMIKPLREGMSDIILRFSSKDLPDVLGKTALEVLPAKNAGDAN